jgi:hypothetical protein
MLVHIDARFFERRPGIGLVFGVVTLAIFAWLWTGVFLEYKGLGTYPELVDLKTISPPRPDHGKWVRSADIVQIDCGNGIQELNDWEQRFLFGRARETYYVARLSNSSRVLLLEYDGEAGCQAISRVPLTGVLEELRPLRRDSLRDEGLALPTNGTVLKLCLTCNPGGEKRLLLYFLILPFFSGYFIVRYGRKYRRQTDTLRP